MIDKFYHGSMFGNQKELKPGYYHTKQLVRWDHIENNKFLYVTTDLMEAMRLGVASAFEKQFNANRVTIIDGKFHVYIDPEYDLPSPNDVKRLEVYVYTIPNREEDGWVKVNNPFNHIDTEYKTGKFVIPETCVRINIDRFFKEHEFMFTHESPNISAQNLEDTDE